MRLVFYIIFCYSISLNAKEWKSIKAYQNETNLTALSSSDWLKSDRKRNTLVWHNANRYNLINDLSSEYISIVQRRDFYKWYFKESQNLGHEVVWPKMAYYISKKLRLTDAFPLSIFSTKALRDYSKKGSQSAFNNSFNYLKELFNSKTILKSVDALEWDKTILYQEQYIWLENVYKTIDKRTLKKIDRISKGKFLYGLFVPKKIRFKGNISDAERRYNYAIFILREYCKTKFQ